MFEQHQVYQAKLDECFQLLQKNTDIRARSTLWKFYRNCSKLWSEMDKEMVNCRRSNRVTPKYTDLATKFNESIAEFEQWLTLAALMF